jgi:phage gp16-like protein
VYKDEKEFKTLHDHDEGTICDERWCNVMKAVKLLGLVATAEKRVFTIGGVGWTALDETAAEAGRSAANERQVGGDHYRVPIQHWDYAAAHDFDYFQGQVTKYVTRWKKKGGIQDLEKARHFLDKYIELEKAKNQHPKPVSP